MCLYGEFDWNLMLKFVLIVIIDVVLFVVSLVVLMKGLWILIK